MQSILLDDLERNILVNKADYGFDSELMRTWKLRNQILLSSKENVRTWSTKGFARRAV